ncbi:MAG: iron-containing alcohol dehydrogenase family protein [Lachnospiraceae bacterium]|nr:iron-containing alcohol dehydrogenase family protein [Lachnospiraceae bacterium]
MNYYNVCLPNYSIGEDCYKEIPYFARHYGKKAVVIGGKTAMAKAKAFLLEGIKDSDMEILDFIWFGGDSTYENGNALIANKTVQDADIIFGVGGGRACDTCKYVANEMDKPLFNFPTVGSNCASVTSISVIYNPDGSFREYYYPKIADHTFINSAVIADSPYELLWAGIGDALSKEYEAVFSSKDDDLTHTPLMGVQLSKICTEPLLTYGQEALESCEKKQVTKALEQVILDIIISTGLVSNMCTQIPNYYYNSSLAHCVYYGSTVTKGGHAHLHGEVVALGVLCMLTYENQNEMCQRIMKFNHAIGLPVCFDDVDISEDEFETMTEKAMTTTEWEFRPKDVTKEKFIQCMKEQNAIGRTFKGLEA